jgi:hypothetical protein
MTASQFILVYDSERKALERHEQFRDPAAAAESYRGTERAYRDRPEIHVVMLSGKSLDTLAATHGTYFKEPFEFIKDLDASRDGAAGE